MKTISLRCRAWLALWTACALFSPLHGSDEEALAAGDATYLEADAAFENGDFALAAELFRKGAKAGHRRSQVRYADCLARGKGVEKDDRAALNQYRRAAIRGEPEAQQTLGLWYETGREVEADVNQAIYWYKIAAAQGNTPAEAYLGNIYLRSAGSNGGIEKGLAMLKEAAEKDSAVAHFYLAQAYEAGMGVDADPAVAMKHWVRAAELGEGEAQYHLADIYLSGMGVEANGETAALWMTRAADHNHPKAAFLVALWTHEGTLYEREEEAILQRLQQAAELGHGHAVKILDFMNQPGESLDSVLTRYLGAATADPNQARYLRQTAEETEAALAETGNRNPRPIRIVTPVYPKIEGLGEVHGRVILLIKIDEEGYVVDATVTESFHKSFNQAAIDAVLQWRFQAALKDGVAVPSRIKLPLKF